MQLLSALGVVSTSANWSSHAHDIHQGSSKTKELNSKQALYLQLINHINISAIIRNTIEQPLIGIQAMHNNTGFHSASCENQNTVEDST